MGAGERQYAPVRDRVLHDFRRIGNFGAHPNKSPATGEDLEVEDGEADWTLDTLDALFGHLFVEPARLAVRKAALTEKLIGACLMIPGVRKPQSTNPERAESLSEKPNRRPSELGKLAVTNAEHLSRRTPDSMPWIFRHGSRRPACVGASWRAWSAGRSS